MNCTNYADGVHECRSKLYAYQSGENRIFLCWKCGAFYFTENTDARLAQLLSWNPMLLLDLIASNDLIKC